MNDQIPIARYASEMQALGVAGARAADAAEIAGHGTARLLKALAAIRAELRIVTAAQSRLDARVSAYSAELAKRVRSQGGPAARSAWIDGHTITIKGGLGSERVEVAGDGQGSEAT
jgi:hypothetical protein